MHSFWNGGKYWMFTLAAALGAIAIGVALFGGFAVRVYGWGILARLRARMLDAVPDNRSLYMSLERLSRRAQCPVPTLYLLADNSPNAFALRNGGKPVIALTEGLLHVLSQEEIAAVLSLCLAQLRLRDFRRSSLATISALPFSQLAQRLPLGFAIFFQSLASLVVRTWLRPERMYNADEYAAQLLQNRDQIALALRKLTTIGRRVPLQRQDIAYDHLFVVPAIRDDLIAGACSSHPLAEDRIQRLLRLEASC